ncbi:MAG: FAD:protein FMN transferase [Oscillospiraceae bacterium]|nr:FAD:protein FMN transferase [Oscillospiraceae bacterium]
MKKLIPIALFCLLLCGCRHESQATVYHMNTVMTLQLWGPDSEAGMEAVDGLLSELEGTWSATRGSSVLTSLNSGEDAALTEAQAALLERVDILSERTGGAFDPHLLTLSQAWGFGTENQAVPSPDAIAAALEDSQWDLGGALKGYAGQEAANLLDTMDIDRALLNLGGNIQTYGSKADGSPWQIGIQNPDGGDYLGILSVTGTCSIVTSGDYQRYFKEDGIRYHHILDPETGYPADSGLRSVTIICRDGLTADALSTALFVMGLEDGIEHWRESDDFEAVFITTDGTIYATEGAALSGCEYEVIQREE